MTFSQVIPQAAHPAAVLAAGAVAVLVLELVLPAGRARRVCVPVAVVALALAGLWAALGGEPGAQVPAEAQSARSAAGLQVAQEVSVAGSSVTMDGIARWAYGVVTASGVAALALAAPEVDRDEPAAFLALLLLAACGMGLLASAQNLVVLFLGLELLSLSLYVMVAYRRDDRRAQEGALKYFLLGSFASGLLLMGIALVYGATGRFDFAGAGRLSGEAEQGLVRLGMALVLAGVGFKLALAPFHLWAPDAYEGAGLGVAAFMSVATKASALVALIRLAASAPGPSAEPLWALAAASMLVGSLGALRQVDFRRLMAYSGIANAGYLLIALPGLQALGIGACAFYLTAYLFANMGLFAVAAAVEQQQARTTGRRERLRLEGFDGLADRHPWLAWAGVLFLVSLTGLPLTGGFVGKFLLVQAAVAARHEWLAGVLVASTAILAYPYWKLAERMLRRAPLKPVPQAQRGSLPTELGLAAAVCLAATVALGVVPQPLIRLATSWLGVF